MSVLNNFRSANGAEFRHGERKGCLKGTRGAILNGIELWARPPNKSPVYWLNGLAGTGKSTIAKSIAERLFADGQLGGSFFCSRDFEDRRNIQLIFPTLATQLARNYPEFRSVLIPLIQSDPGIGYVSLYHQMEKLIVQPLIKSNISTVIVVDALDECEDQDPASAILSVLGRWMSEIPKAKFFLTGRPEPRISEGFRLPLLVEITDIFVLHMVQQDQVHSDIQLFLKNSFSELAGRRHGLDNWPTEEQLDQLCTRAAGLFVYAAATVKFISHYKRSPRRQLELLLQSQKIGDHEGETLDSLYTSIIWEAFGCDKPEDDIKTCSILGAVILATNPLSPSSIATLLGLDAEDVPPLLSSISSLLILQGDPDLPVRPFHKSFPDFITNPTRCTNPRFHISPSVHHRKILLSCLDLMGKRLKRNICNLDDHTVLSEVEDLSTCLKTHIGDALEYACQFWTRHLVEIPSSSHDVEEVYKAIDGFFTTCFLSWIEVLSLTGNLNVGVYGLNNVQQWYTSVSYVESTY
jgi:hypothetical protein